MAVQSNENCELKYGWLTAETEEAAAILAQKGNAILLGMTSQEWLGKSDVIIWSFGSAS